MEPIFTTFYSPGLNREMAVNDASTVKLAAAEGLTDLTGKEQELIEWSDILNENTRQQFQSQIRTRVRLIKKMLSNMETWGTSASEIRMTTSTSLATLHSIAESFH